MGEGSLLLRVLHEHRDRRANALIDKHYENLVLVAEKNRVTVARPGYGSDLHFDNGFTHIANVATLPPKIRFIVCIRYLLVGCSGRCRAKCSVAVQRETILRVSVSRKGIFCSLYPVCGIFFVHLKRLFQAKRIRYPVVMWIHPVGSDVS
jgi:hypothetical protein